MDEEQECLRAHGDEAAKCHGKVTGRRATTVTVFECVYHMDQSLERNRRSAETYGTESDVAPGWIDESYAGERWDDDY